MPYPHVEPRLTHDSTFVPGRSSLFCVIEIVPVSLPCLVAIFSCFFLLHPSKTQGGASYQLLSNNPSCGASGRYMGKFRVNVRASFQFIHAGTSGSFVVEFFPEHQPRIMKSVQDGL